LFNEDYTILTFIWPQSVKLLRLSAELTLLLLLLLYCHVS